LDEGCPFSVIVRMVIGKLHTKYKRDLAMAIQNTTNMNQGNPILVCQISANGSMDLVASRCSCLAELWVLGLVCIVEFL